MTRMILERVLAIAVFTACAFGTSRALACECPSMDWQELLANDGAARIEVLTEPECEEGSLSCRQDVRVLEWCSGAPPGEVRVLTTEDGNCGHGPLPLGEQIVTFGSFGHGPDPHREMIIGGCMGEVPVLVWERECRARRPAAPATRAGCASCGVRGERGAPVRGTLATVLLFAVRIHGRRPRPQTPPAKKA